MKSLGDFFENKAEEYLKNKNYKILNRNWHAGKLGELDIICEKNNILIFVEVKGRSASNKFAKLDAINALNKAKARKLIKSAEFYISKYNQENINYINYRFDLVIVSELYIEHIENIDLLNYLMG